MCNCCSRLALVTCLFMILACNYHMWQQCSAYSNCRYSSGAPVNVHIKHQKTCSCFQSKAQPYPVFLWCFSVGVCCRSDSRARRKGFYESTAQRQLEFTKYNITIRHWGGLARENAKFIVFGFDISQLDLLPGVCLILETFCGHSELPLCRPNPGWPGLKGFNFWTMSDHHCLHASLPCLFLLPAQGLSYHKRSMYYNAVSESALGFCIESKSCGNDRQHQGQKKKKVSHEREEAHDSSRGKLHPSACFNYKQQKLSHFFNHLTAM